MLLSLLFDAIGMLSFTVPGIGEFSDLIWAPVAGWIMTRMYKGRIGQAAGIFTFLEELMPGMDWIPSFTIMWVYTFLFKGSKSERLLESKD